MADKTDIILWADDGDITVGRQTSSFIWGAWDVDVPEGSLDDVDKELSNFKSWGYLYRPDDYKEWSRFDLLGKRADVSQKVAVDENGNPDFNLSESNTEQVIDETQKEVEGEYFFQQSIPTSGLGKYIKPGRDFNVGDTVSVTRWGKLLTVPVRKITSVKTENGEKWSIDVGDSPIKNLNSLSSANSEISKKIKDENLKLMELVEQQKVSIEQLEKFFGLGVGIKEGSKYYEIVDGEKVYHDFQEYNYENFNKKFHFIEGELTKKIEEKSILDKAQEVFLKARNINREELVNAANYPLIPPLNTIMEENSTFENEYIKIIRNGNILRVDKITKPIKLKFSSFDSSNNKNITWEQEFWSTDRKDFSNIGIESDKDWVISGIILPMDIKIIDDKESKELEPKMVNENISGNKTKIYSFKTNKIETRGFYFVAAFKEKVEGVKIGVTLVDGNSNFFSIDFFEQGEVWDKRIPIYDNIISGGYLGFDGAMSDGNKYVNIEVYIYTPDDGKNHTLAGLYIGGEDYINITENAPQE